MPAAGLPESLADSRVLTIGPLDPEVRNRLGELGAQMVVEETSPPSQPTGPPGSFDFIHCGVLPANGRQLLLLARLWQLAAPSASLLLGSRVLADVHASRYLRAETTPAAGLKWIPGRLALRWIVESAGFEALRWLAEDPDVGERSEPFVYLTALRSDRLPVTLGQNESPSADNGDYFNTVENAGGASSGARRLDDPSHVQRVPG